MRAAAEEQWKSGAKMRRRLTFYACVFAIVQFNSSHTMLKPQRLFPHLIDNTTRSWIPILPTKPNALTPLLDYKQLRETREKNNNQGSGASAAATSSSAMDESAGAAPVAAKSGLSAAMSSHIASLGLSTELKPVSASLYPHPYKYEIDNLTFDANPNQLKATKEQLYEPLARVPCVWVDTADALEEMATELDAASEIAIDLEHHSFRSYLGLTCLMQISTRRADWLVDTLALRSSLHRLNTSFTDPAIVKVLHGSDSDIIWLQRDFGLYIVNLFDTGQAARVLEFPAFGLAYLLKFFCDVTTDKKYQMADWRIRPLSAEMLLYARMDTHYLLYIYDRLRNDLISRSTPAQNQLSSIRGCAYLLNQVLDRSKQLCLKTFEKEAAGAGDAPAMEFAYKMGMVLNNDVASRMLVALFHLRDQIARDEDESVFFLCNNQNLAQIIQAQPSDERQLVAACNKPTPPWVRNHGARILAVIQEVKSKGNSLTSPFLASTLPPLSGSPAMSGSTGEAASSLELTAAAMHTPLKPGSKGMFSAGAGVGAGGLPPVSMTPATATSALFAQLSTHHTVQNNPGWSAQSHEGGNVHASAQSPVMSTDQLYSAANWTQAGNALERGIAAQRQGHHRAQSNNGTSLSIPLFDLSGSDLQAHGSPLQRSRGLSASSGLTALLSPAPKHSTFSMLASTAESKSDLQDNQRAIAEVHASMLLAAAPVHPPSAPLPHSTPLKSTTPVSASMMDDDESSQLRTPHTGEPAYSFTSPSPMSLQVIPSPLTVPAAAAATGFTSIAAPAASAALPLGSSGASSPLPNSMREIYKISNENRRNKKKAKLTHVAGAVGSQPMDADDEEGSGSAKASAVTAGAAAAAGGKKKGHTSNSSSAGADVGADGTTSTEFLKNIGWGSGAPPATATQQQTLNNQPNSANLSVQTRARALSA